MTASCIAWVCPKFCARLSEVLRGIRKIGVFGKSLRRLRIGLTVVLALGIVPAWGAEEFSQAERALFLTDHLASVRTPSTLGYTFRKSGSLEEGFEDKVTVALARSADARCCTASTEFLSGLRRVKLPEIESPMGNPVILHFLERDIKEMQRLTKGQPNYFRKRIRMAVFQDAKTSDIRVPYGNATVAAKQIVIAPFTSDPLRQRYEKFADKQYVFTLSSAVPGGVVCLQAPGNDPAPGAVPGGRGEMVVADSAAAPRPPTGTPAR
ncbi:MAG: hypothetical protein LH479_07680 [Polaromonas sp.]|nr:hypothetical protein [Polaromonas sp.]